MSKTYHLIVKMSEVAISIDILDNLASEFYGLMVMPASSGPVEEAVIQFNDLVHSELKSKSNAEKCMNEMIKALNSYRIKPA